MQPSYLWDISFLASINSSTDIVRNNQTNQLMLRRVTDRQSFPVMQALCGIRHPNLMTVFDVRRINGKCVSLCEFINGITLEQKVAQNGVFDLPAAKAVLCGICDGLTELHRNGIVHRDIKPSNVMIDPYGMVKIIDYDITRLVKTHQNRDTTVMGTEGYAAPEQFGFAQTGAKADIYSCGVLLNFLLTGRLPNEQLYQGAAQAIIKQCIEMDESKRFDSAEELKLVLQGKHRGKLNNRALLPGYRGKKGMKVLTTVLVSIWVFFLICSVDTLVRQAADHSPKFTSMLMTTLVMLLFWSALPYCCFGNIFFLSEKLSPKKPKNGMLLLRMIGAASFVAGLILLFIFSQNQYIK